MSATDKTITQIALESGYPNIKAFTAAFKSNFGMIPTQYRKILKETAAIEDTSADNDLEI